MLFLSCFFCHAFSVMLFLSRFSVMLFLSRFSVMLFCHIFSVIPFLSYECFPQIMGRARVKKGGWRAWFSLWEENPRELSVDYQWELSLRIMRDRERWKARRVNPTTLRLMLSPNYGTRACKNGGGRARFLLWEENPRELWVGIIRGLSLRIMSGNYPRKLWPSISMTQKSWDL